MVIRSNKSIFFSAMRENLSELTRPQYTVKKVIKSNSIFAGKLNNLDFLHNKAMTINNIQIYIKFNNSCEKSYSECFL